MKLLKSILNYLIRHQEARVAYWQLANLTDSELRDIGLTRGEIRSLVMHTGQ
jgi:uncharacterized protein YjiS (DUF1127 family)